MILQTASILINRLIILIILLLNQINHEQTEYIIYIDERLFFLNINIISKIILADIQNKKYIYILISSELAVSNRFHATVITSAFKE